MDMNGANRLLEQIVAEPERAAQVSVEQIPALLAQLASVQVVLLSRLALLPNGNPSQGPVATPEDRYLTADEAAAILRRSRRWLYRHKKNLPFVRCISRKVILFSEAGLRRWAAARRS
jgi:hypothetical protein